MPRAELRVRDVAVELPEDLQLVGALGVRVSPPVVAELDPGEAGGVEGPRDVAARLKPGLPVGRAAGAGGAVVDDTVRARAVAVDPVVHVDRVGVRASERAAEGEAGAAAGARAGCSDGEIDGHRLVAAAAAAPAAGINRDRPGVRSGGKRVAVDGDRDVHAGAGARERREAG